VISSVEDPGNCWTHTDYVEFDWSGEDSVGIKEAYYAIGTTKEDPTNVRDWTPIKLTPLGNSEHLQRKVLTSITVRVIM